MKHPVLYGVYLAKFPFLDTNESKIRPVIVVGSPVGDFGITAIVPVSSRLEKQSVDHELLNWNEAGLLKPSVARVHRISTITQENLDAYLGRLSEQDVKSLKSALAKLLSL